MKSKVTIEIYQDDLETWKSWKKKKNKNSAELMHTIMKNAEDKILYDEYVKRDLTKMVNYKKPLSGRKINRYKRNVEKTVAYNK